MQRRSFSTEGIVIKRVNTGEADRVISLLTPDQGKLTCIAKGVRKMSSSQRAYLEPGNHISIFVVQTSSLPILTQTRLITDFSEAKRDLKSIKRLAEILEIIDRLFPEGAEEQQLFTRIIQLLHRLNSPQTSFQYLQSELSQVLVELGYQPLDETKYSSIIDYVEAVADRPMKSFKYLTVRKV
jgi:DNA repair protein RecO (recombination protein O)